MQLMRNIHAVCFIVRGSVRSFQNNAASTRQTPFDRVFYIWLVTLPAVPPHVCVDLPQVRAVYRKKGWALTTTDHIEQCKHDSYIESIKEQKGEGCKMWGRLQVGMEGQRQWGERGSPGVFGWPGLGWVGLGWCCGLLL